MDIVSICINVLERLSVMGFERNNDERTIKKNKNSELNKQLIFPVKNGGVDRISEQELRQLFIEEFKNKHKDLFYSIETPTKEKYKFGKSYDEIEVSEKGQSALLDMCVFKKKDKKYNRILNIEFKHGNAPLKDIGKDVLKLMHEKENGAFIFLLDNTNKGSLNNKIYGKTRVGEMGVLDKLHKSFEDFKENKDNWQEKENEKKCIQLIIISLERKTKTIWPAVLINRTLVNENFNDLKTFFSINKNGSRNISEVSKDSGWK